MKMIQKGLFRVTKIWAWVDPLLHNSGNARKKTFFLRMSSLIILSQLSHFHVSTPSKTLIIITTSNLADISNG